MEFHPSFIGIRIRTQCHSNTVRPCPPLATSPPPLSAPVSLSSFSPAPCILDSFYMLFSTAMCPQQAAVNVHSDRPPSHIASCWIWSGGRCRGQRQDTEGGTVTPPLHQVSRHITSRVRLWSCLAPTLLGDREFSCYSFRPREGHSSSPWGFASLLLLPQTLPVTPSL